MLSCCFEFPLPRFVLVICILAVQDFFSGIKMVGGGDILSNIEIRVVRYSLVLIRDQH